MRASTALLSLLVVAILAVLPSSISGQAVTPQMVSATLDPAGTTVNVIFQSPTLDCPIICWFNLYHDNNETGFVDFYPMSTSTNMYYASVNVNNTAIPNGHHKFFVTQSAIPYPDSDWSNMVGVMVTQPLSSPAAVSSPGAIAGDPQFTGLRGQTYQVHGVPDEVFSIVSDVDLQYNSRFVLLTKGACPSIDDKLIDTPCFTHPGTYLGELGLETAAGDRLYIQAGSATTGFEQLLLNGEELTIGQHYTLKALAGRQQSYVRLVSSHRVVVQAGNFWFEFTNSDMFVNQRVAMIDAKQETSHGLLGQTWSTAIYDVASSIPWIEGSVFDYAMADHQLFSHRFVFNKFVSVAEQDDESNGDATADSEDDEKADEEEAALLERLQRITAAKTRATSGSKHAHKHAHVREWDL